MEISQQLVPDQSRYTFSGINPRTYITVHETANRSFGADAQAHANLQRKGNTRAGSWHWTVDDHEAIQSYEDARRCWHAGDGRGPGNMSSIAIEICVNVDGKYEQAVYNAAELVRLLMRRYNIPLHRVVQHNHFSSYGKNCPTHLRQGDWGIGWNDFLHLVENGTSVDPKPKPPVVKPKPPTNSGGFDMADLPRLDWTKNDLSFSPMDERVQALLVVAGPNGRYYTGELDGRRGSKSRAGLRKFQIDYNCGDGKGGSDMIIGGRTWESLLTGRKWK